MLHRVIFMLILNLVVLPSVMADDTIKETIKGTFLGSKPIVHPAWFRQSFLDLEEDIREAEAIDKRLVLYFWQPGCPYCAELWDNNFSNQALVDVFRQSFEIIALNLWGDREVVHVDGEVLSEKNFADALNIQYTPTLLFFDEKKKVILRLNGYIPPPTFKAAIAFVSGKHERTTHYADFIKQYMMKKTEHQQNPATTMTQEPFFIRPTYQLEASNLQNKYLLVLFEEPNCNPCDALHHTTLRHQETRALLKAFNVVQLNRTGDSQVVTPSGEHLTAQQWYRQLKLIYTPAMVFFDHHGQEIMRVDAHLKRFHIQSVLDYIASGHYQRESNFQKYMHQRAEHIQHAGGDVNIW